jgi:hypothetical protein
MLAKRPILEAPLLSLLGKSAPLYYSDEDTRYPQHFSTM